MKTKAKTKYSSDNQLAGINDYLISEKQEESYNIINKDGKVLYTNANSIKTYADAKNGKLLRNVEIARMYAGGDVKLERVEPVKADDIREFYEEKDNRYFVMGVHLTSQDEESPVSTKWYVEECRLEELSFVVDNRPALAEEFKNNNKRVRFIEQKNAAKDRFKRRMGNLEDKFFDIIPKSLAFKPMDNVKEFINKFVLADEKIDVESLRANIETLSELELLLDRSQKQYIALEDILSTYERIEKKDKDIIINDIDKFTFIHEKTTPIKNDDTDIVFCLNTCEKHNYYVSLIKPVNDLTKKIITFFNANKVFYQSNEIGEIISQYMTQCQKRYILK